MLRQSQIQRAYVALWRDFEEACRSAGLVAKPSDSLGFVSKPLSADVLFVRTLIHLSGWPYRAKSSPKLLDILIACEETFDCKAEEITKSCVKTVYYETNGDEAQPVLGLHYDFDEKVQPQHPVFHAQLGVTVFDPVELLAVGFRKTVCRPRADLYSNARIPTAFMGLGSILLAVIADHLKEKEYLAFLAAFRSNPLTQWSAACTALRESIKTRGGFPQHAHHWYKNV